MEIPYDQPINSNVSDFINKMIKKLTSSFKRKKTQQNKETKNCQNLKLKQMITEMFDKYANCKKGTSNGPCLHHDST